MKKLIVLGVFVGVLCVSTASAMADMWKVDEATASNFVYLGGTDTEGGGSGVTFSGPYYVPGDTPGTYGNDTMEYQVGFVGDLYRNQYMIIGIDEDEVDLGLASTIDEIGLAIANDNDDLWNYQLFVTMDDGTIISSDVPVVLSPGTTTFLSVDLGAYNGANVASVGFIVTLDDNSIAARDNFHTSVVPVPGALLLGFLGLGATGLKLRKFA